MSICISTCELTFTPAPALAIINKSLSLFLENVGAELFMECF